MDYGSNIARLLGLEEQPLVNQLRFQVLIDELDHPEVQGLMRMLQQITVNFYDGKHPIPANVEYIKSLLTGIEAQASLHHKLCLCWTHAMGMVEGEMHLLITARTYEHAGPIGYTLQ